MTKNQKFRQDLALIGHKYASSACRYLHVSAVVRNAIDPKTGLMVNMQTPKGKGATARKDPRWAPPA